MAKIDYNDPLQRRKWVRDGMTQQAAMSIFDPMTSEASRSIVVLSRNSKAEDGHSTYFQLEGPVTARAIAGDETAFGKGETKRVYRDSIRVQRVRFPVDNGTEFDAVDIGALNLANHSDSRRKLGDLWVRWTDQAKIDAASGLRPNGAPTNRLVYHGASFGFNQLAQLHEAIETGSAPTGADWTATGDFDRQPLEQVSTMDAKSQKPNGKPMWYFFIDPKVGSKLIQDQTMQNVISNADVRGERNRLIKGVMGDLVGLRICQVNRFFGENTEDLGAIGEVGSTGKLEYQNTIVSRPGIRYYKDTAGNDGASPNVWLGDSTYATASGTVYARCFVLGSMAIKMGLGKSPDYILQYSEDFKIKSESALEAWVNFDKFKLDQSTGKPVPGADPGGVDFGVWVVDIKVS